MTINWELLGGVAGGLAVAGGIVGKQLAKFLAGTKKDIELELRVRRLEEDMKEVQEEQQYSRRHKHGQ